ncbi:ROK family protein [Flagellimonas sp. 389]|uniref:ROK family protein n=1 Tax=Flagellimonas sp. 389 TaxID=2835862 RepID=UPI002022BDD8|nr:ROK family protein [Flagellimonas sp. 389]
MKESKTQQIFCGIDLGGTKIEGIVLIKNHDDFEIIERLRVPTEQQKGYKHILDQIGKLVGELEGKGDVQISKLGIGTPGTLDPRTQTLKNSNTVCLNGKRLKEDLEELFGFKVEIANDANCFALAEATMGSVPEQLPSANVVFGVIMGTGVGGGVVVNGRSIHGKHGIGGEWGHNFLDASGGECYCGRKGCVETIISGTALERHYKSLGGNRKTLKEIMEAYEKGNDEYAEQTAERLLGFFGKAIASIINILDPEAIVLGGGVGNIDLLYTEGIERVKQHIFNSTLETSFLKPKLGDSAGVFGAAMLTI